MPRSRRASTSGRTGLPDARRRLRARGRRAGRRARRPHPTLRRRGRDRRGRTTRSCSPRSTACRWSDAARATCASWRLRLPGDAGPRGGSRRHVCAGAVPRADRRRRRGGPAGSATTRSSSPHSEPPGGRTLGAVDAGREACISHRAAARACGMTSRLAARAADVVRRLCVFCGASPGRTRVPRAGASVGRAWRNAGSGWCTAAVASG